jgi:hypothetical protein
MTLSNVMSVVTIDYKNPDSSTIYIAEFWRRRRSQGERIGTIFAYVTSHDHDCLCR